VREQLPLHLLLCSLPRLWRSALCSLPVTFFALDAHRSYMQLAFCAARRGLAAVRADARAAAAASVSALGRTALGSRSVIFFALDALRSYVQLALASHGKMARRPLPTSGQLLMLQLRSLWVTFFAIEAFRSPALSVTFLALDVLRSHTRRALAWYG
jgi:hypothetical protein